MWFWKGSNIWQKNVNQRAQICIVPYSSCRMWLLKLKLNEIKNPVSHISSSQKPGVVSDYHNRVYLGFIITWRCYWTLLPRSVSWVLALEDLTSIVAGRFINSPAPSNFWIYNVIIKKIITITFIWTHQKQRTKVLQT